MKIIKCIIFHISYYIFGYLLFNIIFSLTQLTVVSQLGMEENVTKVIFYSLKNNITIYTFLFLAILLINLIYNIILTKRLNERLKNFKEEGEKNEK